MIIIKVGRDFGWIVTNAQNAYNHLYDHNYDNIEGPLCELFQKIDEFKVNESNYFTD